MKAKDNILLPYPALVKTETLIVWKLNFNDNATFFFWQDLLKTEASLNVEDASYFFSQVKSNTMTSKQPAAKLTSTLDKVRDELQEV